MKHAIGGSTPRTFTIPALTIDQRAEVVALSVDLADRCSKKQPLYWADAFRISALFAKFVGAPKVEIDALFRESDLLPTYAALLRAAGFGVDEEGRGFFPSTIGSA